MEPILFYGVPQGCSFGSIVALEWLGRPYRLCRIEMLQHPWPAEYARIHPMFQTPALLTSDGRALTESLAILQHLTGLDLGPQGLGHAQGTPGFDRLNEVLAFLNTDFFSAFGPLWLAYEREDLDDGKKALLRTLGAEAVRKCFAALDGMLTGRAWLVGGRVAISTPRGTTPSSTSTRSSTPRRATRAMCRSTFSRATCGSWLVGGRRSVADAYLVGVARWADYHRLFDMEADYPNVAAHLRKLRADPAVAFADAIERQASTTSAGAFRGHVTLDEALRAYTETMPPSTSISLPTM